VHPGPSRRVCNILGKVLAGAVLLAAALAHGEDLRYELDYRFRLDPDAEQAAVTITLRQPRNLLRIVRFRHKPEWHSGFDGDGEVAVAADTVTWRPPASGGQLRYRSRISHQRRNGGFDSMITRDWALFRGDDLVPPARVTTLKGARSRARIRIDAPSGWSSITPFGKDVDKDRWIAIERTERGFIRPVGWIVAGRIGTRWDDVGATRVVVAGPLQQGVRRMDILAFVRWHLPELSRVFPQFPQRLLIVSAADPMWRGGLSGPQSLYLHADRPLISANGTSTLLHELVHVAQGLRGAPGADWIVEGMAEYYSLEIMRRAGTLSQRRFDLAMSSLTRWGDDAEPGPVDRSRGPVTARGARIMYELDKELRALTGGRSGLDAVAATLGSDDSRVGLDQLRRAAESLAGAPLESLQPERIGIE
jgi:hypothetical protein